MRRFGFYQYRSRRFDFSYVGILEELPSLAREHYVLLKLNSGELVIVLDFTKSSSELIFVNKLKDFKTSMFQIDEVLSCGQIDSNQHRCAGCGWPYTTDWEANLCEWSHKKEAPDYLLANVPGALTKRQTVIY